MFGSDHKSVPVPCTDTLVSRMPVPFPETQYRFCTSSTSESELVSPAKPKRLQPPGEQVWIPPEYPKYTELPSDAMLVGFGSGPNVIGPAASLPIVGAL